MEEVVYLENVLQKLPTIIMVPMAHTLQYQNHVVADVQCALGAIKSVGILFLHNIVVVY